MQVDKEFGRRKHLIPSPLIFLDAFALKLRAQQCDILLANVKAAPSKKHALQGARQTGVRYLWNLE